VLPYFKRSEGNERYSGQYHRVEGPLRVLDQRYTHPLAKAFVQACQDYGLPYNPDFNGERQAGAGLYQVTNHNGRRCSAAVAYLRPARGRPNLTIRTGERVNRIVIENNRAIGVEISERGRSTILRAEREVILTAGALNSPKILLVGRRTCRPSAERRLTVVHDLPGVGQNLHDHLDIFMMYNIRGVHSYDVNKKPHRQLWAGMQYLAYRNGPVTGTIVEGGAFCWADKSVSEPDLQCHFLAGTGVEEVNNDTSNGNGCTLNGYFLHTRSRGSVSLKSADLGVPPIIDPNFLAEPYDMDRTVDCVKVGQEIMSQPSIAKFVVNEFLPGRKCRRKAEYEAYCRDRAGSGYHPFGTCKMGTDEMAVVDPQLRDHGLDGLRVADSPITPRLVSGNTNAPSIMIGERASDFIRGNKIGKPRASAVQAA
jgi:choline dehydrogenase-like flavoprotein